MTRYLVLSDLHLADIEEHEDGWKAHKSRQHTYDDALAETIARFRDEPADDEAPDARRVLVLNGDTLDFDLVTATPAPGEDAGFSVSRRERVTGLDATEAKSAWKAWRVLDDHRVFVEALARFVAASARHDLVIIAGNHDPELAFDAVQRAVLDAMRDAAERADDIDAASLHAALAARGDATARVRFERWFYMVPGEIYVEHGQQYDLYCAQRFVLSPFDESPGREREITLSMGDLSNRLLLGRMGTFNPHASDYILGAISYVGHWLRHYAFTRRSLVGAWVFGSLAVMMRMLRIRRRLRRRPAGYDDLMGAQAERAAVDVEMVEALETLRRRPIHQRVYRMMRELWLDRVLLALVMTGATVALALVPIPLWIKLVVPLAVLPLSWFGYEHLARGETIFAIERDALEVAREVARVTGCKLVTFGHTHRPELVPLGAGATYVNTGTWAPVLRRGELAPGLRNVLEARFADDSEPRIALHSLSDHVLAPKPQQQRDDARQSQSLAA